LEEGTLATRVRIRRDRREKVRMCMVVVLRGC
jgi:hypothetical protein